MLPGLAAGGFDLTNLWTLDEAIAADMASVFAFIAKHGVYRETGVAAMT